MAYRWLYPIALPLIWGSVCLASFQYPGDEYGLWGFGSFAGLSIFWIWPGLGSGEPPSAVLFPVAAAGMATMACFGFLLRCARVRGRWLLLTWGLMVVGLLARTWWVYPTYERAIAKNGSVWAYLFFAVNFSLFAAVLLFVLLAVGYRGACGLRRRTIGAQSIV